MLHTEGRTHIFQYLFPLNFICTFSLQMSKKYSGKEWGTTFEKKLKEGGGGEGLEVHYIYGKGHLHTRRPTIYHI